MKNLPCEKCPEEEIEKCKQYIEEKASDEEFEFDSCDDLEFIDSMIDELTERCKKLKKYFPHEVGISRDDFNVYPGEDECSITEDEWQKRNEKIQNFFEECWPMPEEE